MWTAVFKAGTHTDSQGNEKNWTEADLEKIAQSYEPARHEAPVVIGHPMDNAPAWGWVEGLKREGGVLLAKLKLVPEFAEIIRKGLFKKRSISLYPDLTLRHIGFLGAMPPAVKGLPEFEFKDAGPLVEIELNPERKEVERMKNFLSRLKSLISEEFNEEHAFSEELERRERELQEKERALRAKEAAEFCEGLLKRGKVTPAMMKAGLPKFIEAISRMEEAYSFAEGQGEKTPAVFLHEFLEALPDIVSYSELAKPDGDPETKRQKLLDQYMNANGGSTYRDALMALSAENPEMFR